MIAVAAVAGIGFPHLEDQSTGNTVLAGMSDNATPVAPATLVPDPAKADAATTCNNVTFTRGVKYGADERNFLDVATAQATPGTKRPVVVFIAGENFASDSHDAASPSMQQAMCFAADKGLVAVRMSYRVAPAATWPAGAKDVAAALSWVNENADLFGGNAQEIIPIGYGAGAFHLASFLAHKEFQEKDDLIAGAVLVSGIYHPAAGTSEGARAYFGNDASTFEGRSAINGLTRIEEPILLAWSQADPPDSIAQGEKLKNMLCNAGHCPRVAVLSQRSSPASVFDLDGASAELHDRLRQLIGQIDARGLP